MAKEMEEIDLDQIPDVQGGKGVDLSEFTGIKKKVENITVLDVETPFDESGNYNDKVKRKVKILKVFTEPVTDIVNKEGEKVPVRASELFNMKQTEDGKWGISTNDKAKIRKFMKRQKVNRLSDLKGTTVIIKDYTDKKGNTYLGFVVE